ncbi:MAG: tRNA 2-thiocytidine biosynthesis TtcA family protein [Pseudomonadota bacterium]
MLSPTTGSTELGEEVLRGIREYEMIPPGSKVLLALSGGKDSLTLLHLLAAYREILGVELAAAHVETDTGCGAGVFDRVLRGVCDGLGVPLHRQGFPILAEAGDKLTCFYCAMRRRASLFRLAVDEGYGILAFGHHLDDMAETLVMNALFHGNLSTMTPKVAFFEGALTVIRPLVFVREARMAEYVAGLGLTTAVCGCPYSSDNVRAAIKDWLFTADQVAPGVPERLYGAMRSLGGRT